MSRLDELKSSPDIGRPERTVKVCLAGRLARDLERLSTALFEVEQELEVERAKVRAAEDGEAVGPPKRLGEQSRIPELEQRAQELAVKADEVRERMAQNSVELLLRAVDGGTWRQWVAKHPAREDEADPTGAMQDQRWAAGFCNIDALADDLAQFVAKYDGEPASDDWWAVLSAHAARADLRNAASAVVGLHEQVVDLGKPRLAWLADRRSVNGSE